MLTRQTSDSSGVWQLGVITRRAAVVGSEPPQNIDRSEFDTIAYVGRVIVRLLGGCEPGDYIVPSGRQDGTARGANAATRPVRTVGRALTRSPANKDSLSESLVEISVIGPSDSVDARQQVFAVSSVERRRVLFCLLLLCCTVLALCLIGASHARASDMETGTTHLLSSGEDTPPVGAGCEAVLVSALANRLCRDCKGHDAMVKFAAMEPGTAQSLCPRTHSGSMVRICGGGGHSALRSVESVDGDGDDGGSALLSDGSLVTGMCTRKACPTETFPLLPAAALHQYPSQVEPLCMERGLCQVQLDATPEGSGAVSIPCPTSEGSPFWPGMFTRVCAAGEDQWQRPAAGSSNESTTGDCEWRTCPSGCLSLTRSSIVAPFDATFRASVSGATCPNYDAGFARFTACATVVHSPGTDTVLLRRHDHVW